MPIQRSRSLRPINGLDGDTNMWLGAVAAYGGTVSNTRAQIINDFIVGMKADNNWTKFDRIWFLWGEDGPSARTDLVRRSLATEVGAPTFTANRGYAGELAGFPTSYLESGYKENAFGNKFVQDDCHVSAWIVTPCVGGYWVGQIGHAFEDTSSLFDNSVNIHSDLTDVNGTGPSFAYASNVGHFMNCRTSSTDLTLYQNGSSVATASSASGPVDGNSWAITCINHNTETWENGTNGIIGMVSAGASLASADVTKFFNRLRTLATAIGIA